MGTERKQFTITYHISRHNAPKDHVHDALADLLAAEINALIKSDKYEPINPELSDWHGY